MTLPVKAPPLHTQQFGEGAAADRRGCGGGSAREPQIGEGGVARIGEAVAEIGETATDRRGYGGEDRRGGGKDRQGGGEDRRRQISEGRQRIGEGRGRGEKSVTGEGEKGRQRRGELGRPRGGRRRIGACGSAGQEEICARATLNNGVLANLPSNNSTPSTITPPPVLHPSKFSNFSPSTGKMLHLLRRSHSTAHALSTAAVSRSCPWWAMIDHTDLSMAPSMMRATFELVEPPCATRLLVPARLIDPQPCPTGMIHAFFGHARSSGDDGLLLVVFLDGLAPDPNFTSGRMTYHLDVHKIDPDMTRFVCNPLTGELFRLTDIDGKKNTITHLRVGILTQSDRPRAPPDRYAVALYASPRVGGEEWTFDVRRFLSEKGEWDKLPGLPSPLPVPGRLFIVDSPTLAVCGGELLPDQPELQFIKLPRGSVTTEFVEISYRSMLARYRRMGVSEGRLRYAEVSQKEPFMLSSFAFDDDSGCWTLEHPGGAEQSPGGWRTKRLYGSGTFFLSSCRIEYLDVNLEY
uniref:DUF1618 domain-containing protein n=1 Tax=Leersia perrieri TaxID=77586 RepID=A0A0D9WDY8_9ORYZ